MRWELEEVARLALERADVGVPVDPGDVADSEGLEILHADTSGLLIGNTILISDAIRAERRAFGIAHEIGHHLLGKHRLPNTEASANYLASALILPRPDFESDLRRWGWDLIRLRAKHRHASFEALARRIVALREARAFIFDRPLAGQRRPSWYSVPGGQSPTPHEREAAALAAETQAPVEPVAGVTAWPVFQADWARVIVVSNL